MMTHKPDAVHRCQPVHEGDATHTPDTLLYTMYALHDKGTTHVGTVCKRLLDMWCCADTSIVDMHVPPPQV